MKHQTRMKNLSELIKRARSGVGKDYADIKGMWLFGGAMRGEECGDIDIVVDICAIGKLHIWEGCKPLNYEKCLIELRLGMQRIEFHPMSDVEYFVGTPLMRLF